MQKIVVVDDEREIVNLLERFLIKEGFEVVKCYGGKEALDFINSEGTANLILLDRRMPEIDGIAVLKELERLNKGIPVIVLSGSGGGSAKNMKIDAFLEKPLNLDILLDKIKEVLKARESRE